MVLRADQDRICKLIKDTLTLLCKNGLTFDLEFSIDALIGVTLDKNDVFLVKIDEQVKSEKAKRAEQEAADAAERADQVESYGDTDSESDAGSGSRKRGLSGAAQRKKRRKMMEENQENGQSDDDETHDQDSRTDQHRVKQEDGEGDNVIVIKEEMDDSWQGDDFTGQFSLPGTSTQEPNFSTQDANFPSLADMTFTPVGQDTSQVWAQSTAYASPSSMGRGRPSVGSSQLDPSQETASSHVQHFLRRLPSTAKKSHPRRRCRLCYSQGLRKDTPFVCAVCPITPALCVTPCFEEYHSTRNIAVEKHNYTSQNLSTTLDSENTVSELYLYDDAGS